jgi:hypothetical protein
LSELGRSELDHMSGRFVRRLTWCILVAVAVWIVGSIGRAVIDALIHSPFERGTPPFGPQLLSWQATLARWVATVGELGKIAAEGLIAILLALGLRDAGRRYRWRRVEDVTPSTAPDRSAR